MVLWENSITFRLVSNVYGLIEYIILYLSHKFSNDRYERNSYHDGKKCPHCTKKYNVNYEGHCSNGCCSNCYYTYNTYEKDREEQINICDGCIVSFNYCFDCNIIFSFSYIALFF
jgi:hypothetical protein